VASTIVWECSEGKFNWYYDFDETILVLEGSIVLENDTMGPTRYGPGDVIFFRDGAHAKWHVEGPGQEARVLSQDQSSHARLRAAGLFSKIKRKLAPAGKRRPASLMGTG